MRGLFFGAHMRVWFDRKTGARTSLDGVTLRAIRGARSIPDVARSIGCSVASLSVWETEGGCPSTESIEALRRFYGATLDDAITVESWVAAETRHLDERFQERMDDEDAQ